MMEAHNSLQALLEKASLPFAFASDVVASIASHHFEGVADLDRALGAHELGRVFPFWSSQVVEKDAFYGQVLSELMCIYCCTVEQMLYFFGVLILVLCLFCL